LANLEVSREVATLGAGRTTSRHSVQVGDIAAERGPGLFADCLRPIMSTWSAIRKGLAIDACRSDFSWAM